MAALPSAGFSVVGFCQSSIHTNDNWVTWGKKLNKTLTIIAIYLLARIPVDHYKIDIL